MKRTLWLLLAVLAVMMIASAHAETSARGVWEMQSFFDGTATVADPRAVGTEKKVVFLQDGTAKVTIVGNGKTNVYAASWQRSGDIVLLEYDDGDRGVFSFEGDQLVYRSGEQIQYFTKTAAFELKDALGYFTLDLDADKAPYGFYIDQNHRVQAWCPINRNMERFVALLSKWEGVTQLIHPVGGECYMGVNAQGRVLCATPKNSMSYRLKFIKATEWRNIREIKQLDVFISGVGYDGKLRVTPGVGVDVTTAAFQKADGWNNIVDIVQYSSYGEAIACLTSDGHVRVGGANPEYIWDATDWSDIVQIASTRRTILGLSADGRVYQAGEDEPFVDSWGPVKCLLDGTYREFGYSEGVGALAADDSGFYLLRSAQKYEWKGIHKMAYSNIYGMMGIDQEGNLAIYGDANATAEDSVFHSWHDLVDLRVHHDGILGLRADGVLLCMCRGKETAFQLGVMPLGW